MVNKIEVSKRCTPTSFLGYINYMMKKLVLAVLLASVCLTLPAGGSKENNINQGIVNSNMMQSSDVEQKSISEILYSISNLYAYLDKNFLYEIDNEVVSQNLIAALVNSLGDEYSYYISAEDAESFEEDVQGEYVGIGTYVSKVNPAFADYNDPETYMLIIVSPFPGGPADRAGLRANDLISAIDGTDVSGLDATEASQLLRGTEGKEMTLSVLRGTSSFEIKLVPEKVVIPTCVYGMLEDGIAYLGIYEFTEASAKSVEEAVSDLKKNNPSALIIDLRNNGGGIVDSCLEIADFFLSDGDMVSIKYKDTSGMPDVTYQADRNTIMDEEIPLVLLVNGGTASSSEIMTAALKENGRATVIGSQTFGKGIMQSVIPYSGGYIRFTSADYYTPDGNNINKKGIQPDIIIEEKEYTDEEMQAYEDFMHTDSIASFISENPDYSIENIEKFASEYAYTGVPHDILCLLLRNEYIYSMDIDDRPVATPDYDPVLSAALEFIKEGR